MIWRRLGKAEKRRGCRFGIIALQSFGDKVKVDRLEDNGGEEEQDREELDGQLEEREELILVSMLQVLCAWVRT